MNTVEPFEDYISAPEASKRYGISRTHASLLAKTGKVKAVRVTGNWLIHVPSLEWYLAHRPKPGPKVGAKMRRKRP